MRRRASHLSVTFPPLVLAALGLTHPRDLTPATADWWTLLHVLLVPVFPLLGVALWGLVRGIPGLLAWAVRIAGFLYAAFYGVIDAVAGIGTGTLVRRGLASGTGQDDPVLTPLFAVGNEVGTWGAWAFLVGAGLLTVLAWRRWGRATLPGGLITVAAAWSFLSSHIYWPVGVGTMVALALGLGLLVASRLRWETRAAAARRRAEPGGPAESA